DDWAPPLAGRSAGHAIDTPRGPAWFEPVPDVDGVWLEIRGPGDGPRAPGTLAAIGGAALGAERDAAQVAAELAERYAERIVSYDPTDAQAVNPGCPEGRTYKGKAFLSVPVLYATPGERAKPIGVINLTDRLGADAFTAGDRKLVAAIANQIGAAIENATLVAKDLSQQRVQRELELAHDLQLKLLPSPLVIAARVDVAARCRQAESVGGDFYNLLNLP